MSAKAIAAAKRMAAKLATGVLGRSFKCLPSRSPMAAYPLRIRAVLDEDDAVLRPNGDRNRLTGMKAARRLDGAEGHAVDRDDILLLQPEKGRGPRPPGDSPRV